MTKKLFFHLFSAGLFLSLASPIFALEKVKLGTPTKTGAASYLPVLTGEQKGFWKKNGLEVEWVPFAGAAPLMRAAVADILNIGLAQSDAVMTAAEKALPLVMVAEYIYEYPFYLWVRTDSPYQQVRDLKGTRIGVTTLGGSMHAYGRVIAKTHGIEKDVRFVGAGGTVQSAAGFKAGAFEAMLQGMPSGVRLKLAGLAREIASTADYLPKPWVQYTVFTRKDYAQSKPEVVRKVVRASLQVSDFVRKNPRWALDLMKSQGGFSEEEAKLVYDTIKFSITGKIDRRGVENARKLYIEYGLLTEKAPAVDEFFTNAYLPG